jgi:D-3-phosphoglycerate dehydrogenase
MRLRILNAEPDGYCDEARRILQSIGEVVEENVSQERLASYVSGFDVLIVRLNIRVTREVLRAGKRLKAVVSATTGLDHIDLQAARESGIAVLSLKDEQEFLRTVPATAEHTWALVLSLARRIPWAFSSVLEGEWERDTYRGMDLQGRHLGLLGLGRVGAMVAGYGAAFGMKVGAYDPYCQDWVEGVFRFDTMESLLRWSEILTIHMPLNEETHGIINYKQLHLLPRGSLLVNTARGALLDEYALVSLLETGHIGGAAVDVLAGEQFAERRQQSPLLHYARRHKNLLITPHLGGATSDSMRKTEVFMAKKLRRFLKG